MLKKGLRLRKKEDFDRVFRSGKPLFFNEIGCRYLENKPSLRLGFSFSKKHIPLATKRNRLRRVLSEAFSQFRDRWPESGDIVFFTVRKPKKANIQDGQAIVKNLLDQIKRAKKTQ
ncbi:MAG: ribonuclease P protein component [Candidatus Moraniibacteriota bacterium]